MNYSQNSKYLQKWVNSVRSAFKRFWREINPPSRVSAAAPIALDALPVESEPANDEAHGSIEVQVLSRQITAYCATCSAAHDLNLVCALCGATLCDEPTCSVKRDYDLIEQVIVLCHTCAAERAV